MNQYEFDKILTKYLAGQQSPEEEDFILEHLKENPFNETLVFENEREVIGKRIKAKVHNSIFGRTIMIRLRPWLLSAAACALLVLGLGYIFGEKQSTGQIYKSTSPASQGVVEVKNTSDKPQNIPLEDGSVVTLKKNSSLSFPEHFGHETRLVYLHGEAFFQIKRDPSKPFIVSAGDLTTKVLGTSFSVKSYDDAASVEVQVKSGRVSVYEEEEQKSANRNGVILTPNQKITFDKKTKKMQLAIVENPAMIIPKEKILSGFTFTEVPVKTVFADLEKSYGIDIVLENDVTDNCLFTGDLNGLNLFEQLDLICKSVNVSYERRGTALFVQGAGCGN